MHRRDLWHRRRLERCTAPGIVFAHCITVTSDFTVQATDSQGQTANRSERIRVSPSPMCTANCSMQVTLAGNELFVTSPARPPCGWIPGETVVQCETYWFLRDQDGTISGNGSFGWNGIITGWIGILGPNGGNLVAGLPFGCPPGQSVWVDLATWDGINLPQLVLVSNVVQCPGEAPLPPNLTAPAEGAVIQQNNPASGCPLDPTRGQGFTADLEWAADPAGIPPAHYELVVQHPGFNPLESVTVDDTRFQLVQCGGFIADANLSGWEWRVRSVDAAGNTSAWSTRSFSFGPCRLANGTPCHVAPPG